MLVNIITAPIIVIISRLIPNTGMLNISPVAYEINTKIHPIGSISRALVGLNLFSHSPIFFELVSF